MPNHLNNTEWMSSVDAVPITETFPLPLTETSMHEWVPLVNGLSETELDLWNVESLQPIPVQSLQRQELLLPSEEENSLMLIDLGGNFGNEGGFAVPLPPPPIQVDSIYDGIDQHDDGRTSDQIDAQDQLRAEHPGAAHFEEAAIEESDRFQGELHVQVGTMDDAFVNKTETGALPEDLDVVAATPREDSIQTLDKHRRQEFAYLSPKEIKRLKKNAYSKSYRQSKKELLQQLERENALLKEHKAKLDDILRRVLMSDASLQLQIKMLMGAQGGAGTATSMLTE